MVAKVELFFIRTAKILIRLWGSAQSDHSLHCIKHFFIANVPMRVKPWKQKQLLFHCSVVRDTCLDDSSQTNDFLAKKELCKGHRVSSYPYEFVALFM